MSQLRIVTYIVMGLLFTLGASDALAKKIKEEKVAKQLLISVLKRAFTCLDAPG